MGPVFKLFIICISHSVRDRKRDKEKKLIAFLLSVENLLHHLQLCVKNMQTANNPKPMQFEQFRSAIKNIASDN